VEGKAEQCVRHVVLSAFGCGAFGQPAEDVANIYQDVLKRYDSDFDVVVFAIFYPGYGPDNWTPFKNAFQEHDAANEQQLLFEDEV
jgi:uncharacterized protein (TIGR02452 family)